MNEYFKNNLEGTPGNNAPNEPINNETLMDWMDYAFKESGGPGYSSVMYNALRGIRMLGPGNQQIPVPDDCIGLAFMTRPTLNLSDENVGKHPQLLSLYNPEPGSVQAYVKGLLDPQWGRSNHNAFSLLDPLYPWIPLVTNLLKVSSGFPDLQINTERSDPGLRKQVYQYINGILQVNYDYDMSLSFHAMKPNILPYMFSTWLHYMEGVTVGDEGMEPYPEALIGNYRDYDCRIYHIILNKNFRNIEGIYMNGYCWPNSFPAGAFSTIDTTSGSLRGQGQDELSINFPSIGFRFDNVRVCDQFNRSTEYFNPYMKDGIRQKHYRKLEVSEYYEGGYHSYPYIDIDSMTLEYWGEK